MIFRTAITKYAYISHKYDQNMKKKRKNQRRQRHENLLLSKRVTSDGLRDHSENGCFSGDFLRTYVLAAPLLRTYVLEPPL